MRMLGHVPDSMLLPRRRRRKRLRRIEFNSFCDVPACTELAVWSVRNGLAGGQYCARHTVLLMSNASPWKEAS